MDQRRGASAAIQVSCVGCARDCQRPQLCAICRCVSFCSSSCVGQHLKEHGSFCHQIDEAQQHCDALKDNVYKAALGYTRHKELPVAVNAFGYEDADVKWRKSSVQFYLLSDATCALVAKKVVIFGADCLPKKVLDDSTRALDLMVNLGFPHNPDLKRCMPALYICQRRDQEAFDYIKWFDSGLDETTRRFSLGRSPFALEQHRGKHMLERYSDKDVQVHSHAKLWYLRVPLALIKVRLLLDLLHLERNFDEIGGLSLLRKVPKVTEIVSSWVFRAGIHYFTWTKEAIGQYIVGLQADIEKIATFDGFDDPAWGKFWVHMLFNGHKIISNDTWPGMTAIPDNMRTIIKANYHSWKATAGAFLIMEQLGFLKGR